MKKKLLLLILLFVIQHFSFCQTYTSSLLLGTPPETSELNPQKFSHMTAMVANSKGEIFVCDKEADVIRKIQNDHKIVTIAGNGVQGYKDGKDTSARFQNPMGIVVDSKGNLFIIESSSSKIRKITPDGTVSTYAGTAGYGDQLGTKEEAKFTNLGGITIDNKDNIYVTDIHNKKIKKIDSTGIVTTVLENLIAPGVITIEKRNNILYFDDDGAIMYYDFSYLFPLRITEEFGIPLRAEMLYCDEYMRPIFSHRGGLFKIEENFSTGKRFIKRLTYSYYTSCTFSSSRGTVFGSGSNLYKFDSYNNTFIYIEIYPLVTKIYPNKDFKDIQGMIIDENENLFMADMATNRILKMDKFGTISTFAGDYESGLIDGNGTQARFNGPSRLAWDNYGNILVTDNNTLRKISPNGDVTTFKDANQKPLYALGCYGIAVDKNDNIFLAQYSPRQTIKKITPENVISDYIDINFMKSFGYDFGMPYALQIDKLGNLIIAIQADGMIYVVSPDKSKVRWIGDFAGSSIDGHTRYADFRAIEDIILDKDGNLFVLDVNTIRKISPDSLVTTIVGEASKNSGLSGGYKEGIGAEIKMNMPWCMAMNKNGDFYVSDNGNNLIRVIRKNVVTGVNASGIEEVEVSGFNLFPNPAKDKITVHSPFEGSLGVYNIEGRLVFENTNSPKKVTIDFNNYPRGLYYVVFQTSDKMYKKTLVLE